MLLDTVTVTCPYCWEPIDVEVDTSALPASYVEDCSVCCRPILLDARIDPSDGGAQVTAVRENE